MGIIIGSLGRHDYVIEIALQYESARWLPTPAFDCVTY
jgi:hypothetical protein